MALPLIGARVRAAKTTYYPNNRLPGTEGNNVVGRIESIEGYTEFVWGDVLPFVRVNIIDDAGVRHEATPEDIEIL